jgi:hypothetical protein
VRTPAVAVGSLALMLAGPGAVAGAQRVARSQLAVVTQMVADTRVEITWRRPVARGRELFGSLVPWGQVWTPSADSAARISLSGPIEINGKRLAAGTYGIWTIPDSTSWTVIFSSVAPAFHRQYPDGHDVLRLNVVPAQGEHVETLSFGFPMVDADSGLLQLRWGKTIVPMSIRVR